MDAAGAEAATAQFLADGSGPFASNLAEAGAFLRLGPGEAYPDVQVHFSRISGRTAPMGPGPTVTALACDQCVAAQKPGRDQAALGRSA